MDFDSCDFETFFVVCCFGGANCSSFRSFWFGGATGTTEDRKKVVIIFRALSLSCAREKKRQLYRRRED